MDNIDRRDLVACGLVQEYNLASFKSFKDFDRSALDDLEDRVGLEIVEECRKVSHNTHARRKRCKVKIGDMVFDGKAYFVTLTFSDDALANSTEKQRRRWIARALKKFGIKYIANIDYGKQNGREHYHAIVEISSDKIEKLKKFWNKHGFLDFRKVGDSQRDLDKTTKYVDKLTAHAFKDSTHRRRLIISRDRI